ncbi:MAG: hypothetical protein ACUVRV_06645 [Cyanobacteriota bacterium]
MTVLAPIEGVQLQMVLSCHTLAGEFIPTAHILISQTHNEYD